VLDEIHNNAWMFEREPMDNLTTQRQVHAFRHRGFWQAMDTLRDKQRLEELWAEGRAPWKKW
jgi:glucose-1-phosphate cytidylyltransferase